ncbi:uncharacterized protein [Asterias amurensis]|uniref:uncharacterized protein isoform X1 n=1 Tax=Asterias amurensis TaxID=7602 RepID=UPI003AB4CA11
MAAIVNAVTELPNQEYSLDVTLSDNRVIHNVMVDKELRDRLEQGDPLAFQALQLAAETSEMIDASSYTEVETTTTTAVPVSPSNEKSGKMSVETYKRLHGEKSPEKWKRGWSQSAEKTLLLLYIECRDEVKKWEKIAELFEEKMHVTKTKLECRLKIKTLKNRYIKQRRHNSTPGNLMIRMDELFEDAFAEEVEDEEKSKRDSPIDGAKNTRGVYQGNVKWMQSIAGEEPDDETIILPDEPEEEEELKRGAWTNRSEQALLQCYVRYRDHAKQKWHKVALVYNRHAKIKKSSEACRLKVKSLHHKYMRDKRNNETPGKSQREIDSYTEEVFSVEDNSLFEKTLKGDPGSFNTDGSDIGSPSVCSTPERVKRVFKNPRKPKPKRTKLTHVGVENDHGGNETFVQSFTGSEVRHSSGDIDKLIDFLREQEKRQSLASEQHHIEKMSIMKELVAAIRDYSR